MDIASLSMNMAQNRVMNEFSTAVLAKSLDNMEIEGANVANMIDSAAMERSVNPAVGGNIDLLV